MQHKLTTGVLAALLLMGGVASAAPTIQGTTGAIATPDAAAAKEGSVTLGHFQWDGGHSSVAAIGLGGGLEVSGSLWKEDGRSSEGLLNAKWALVKESAVTPGLAVGVDDLADKRERSVYAAVSKDLPLGLKLSAGVGDGRYDGGFVAAEVPVFIGTKLILENDSQHFNYGVRFTALPCVTIDAGRYHKETYVGASVRF